MPRLHRWDSPASCEAKRACASLRRRQDTDTPAKPASALLVTNHLIGELRFPAELDGTERVIFVPAPLPASWIETILFRSNDEKRTCEADARDFGNVPLSDFARKVATRRFANRPFDAS